MSDLVLDASLALQWFLADEADRKYSLSVLSSLSEKPGAPSTGSAPRSFDLLDQPLSHSNAVRMHCYEALEATEIRHVHGEYVVDGMHVHCRC